jgi:hypothetical protein
MRCNHPQLTTQFTSSQHILPAHAGATAREADVTLIGLVSSTVIDELHRVQPSLVRLCIINAVREIVKFLHVTLLIIQICFLKKKKKKKKTNCVTFFNIRL